MRLISAPPALLLGCAVALLKPYTAEAWSPPQWVQAQVNAPIPEHDEKTSGVLLYSETVLNVRSNGKLVRLDRRVYRILRPDGDGLGIVRVDLDSQTKLSNLHGWSIPSTGKGYDVGERDAVESSILGVFNGELMSDVRTKLLRIPASVPGSIVAYEWEVEQRPYQLTDEWQFEDTVPVREARYTLQLPAGWSYKVTWINHSEQSPQTSGTTATTWVLQDLKPIEIEERMPPWRGIAGRMVVSVQPPNAMPRGFSSWSEMGRWYQELARGRTEPSAQIKQKVADLTQGSTTAWDKMKRLSAFVQDDIRYVAIELGIGGLQPHSATDVFTHRYGDCKDKVTLLKSMLAQIGIESDYFIINTERGSITQDTPANLGFNHVILAIDLPAGIEDPAMLAVSTDTQHGRILFFDPTDPLTPFGNLRGALQADYGLLVTTEGGVLMSTPKLGSQLNSIERHANMTLDENGTLHGDVHEVWTGDRASDQRAIARESSQDTDKIKPIEAVVADSFTSFDILKAAVTAVRVNDRPVEWNYTLEAPHYAKSAGDMLLVRPRLLGTKSTAMLETKHPRRFPIEFTGAERDSDVFEVELPKGYVVDALPEPVNEDYGFISYHSRTEAVGHKLRYTRTFEIRDLSVPVDKAGQLKELYRIIYQDERAQAVLAAAGSAELHSTGASPAHP
jgi:transglutaminase-like putative cysteine protease